MELVTSSGSDKLLHVGILQLKSTFELWFYFFLCAEFIEEINGFFFIKITAFYLCEIKHQEKLWWMHLNLWVLHSKWKMLSFKGKQLPLDKPGREVNLFLRMISFWSCDLSWDILLWWWLWPLVQTGLTPRPPGSPLTCGCFPRSCLRHVTTETKTTPLSLRPLSRPVAQSPPSSIVEASSAQEEMKRGKDWDINEWELVFEIILGLQWFLANSTPPELQRGRIGKVASLD